MLSLKRLSFPLLSKRPSLYYPAFNRFYASQANQSQTKITFHNPLELPKDLIKDEKLEEIKEIKSLPNTRGEFREQICRTPFMRTSTKKLNMLAHLITGLPVEKAMLELMFLPKDDTKEILWAIREGCQIAKEIQQFNPENFYVAYAYVCRGSYEKALDIKGRGRTGRIKKPKALMVIMLRDKKILEKNRKLKVHERPVKFPRQDRRIINARISMK